MPADATKPTSGAIRTIHSTVYNPFNAALETISMLRVQYKTQSEQVDRQKSKKAETPTQWM